MELLQVPTTTVDPDEIHPLRWYSHYIGWAFIFVGLPLTVLQLWHDSLIQKTLYRSVQTGVRFRLGKHEQLARSRLHLLVHRVQFVIALFLVLGGIDRFGVLGLQEDIVLSVVFHFEAGYLILLLMVLIAYFYLKGVVADIRGKEPVALLHAIAGITLFFILLTNVFLLLALLENENFFQVLIFAVLGVLFLVLGFVVLGSAEFLSRSMKKRLKRRVAYMKSTTLSGEAGTSLMVESQKHRLKRFRKEGRKRSLWFFFAAMAMLGASSIEDSSGEFWVNRDYKNLSQFEPNVGFWGTIIGLYVTVWWFWIRVTCSHEQEKVSDGDYELVGGKTPATRGRGKSGGFMSPRTSRAQTRTPTTVVEDAPTVVTVGPDGKPLTAKQHVMIPKFSLDERYASTSTSGDGSDGEYEYVD